MLFKKLISGKIAVGSLALCMSSAITLGLMSSPVLATDTLSPVQQKVWKEWTYSLALQAGTWGSPLVTMYALRYHDALSPDAKAKPNEIWRMENISTPQLSVEAGYVSPNVNTLYGFGFMDLRQEPIILEVPDSNNRYYMVEIVDMWTNAFAYVGGKTTGYKGGKYALVGPGWQGTLPDGVKRIDAPTPWVLLQPRIHLYDEQGNIDLPGTKKILQNITTTGLAKYTGKPAPVAATYDYPAPQAVDPKQPVSAIQYKDPLQFWEMLSVALNENPPPQDQISALLPMLEPLGIELGKPWDRNKLAPEVLDSMAQAAKDLGPLLPYVPLGTFYKGAFLPPATIGDFGNDYRTRAIVARVGLTANTPYEAVYWDYTSDSQGNLLNGKNKYTMTFKEGIPYYEPGFWSLTLYDATNNYTVENPINRYMLGSDSKDLQKNADGSFTIYIQNENPGKDKESNWLPAPQGPFYLIPRAYAPKPETIAILSDVNAWPVPLVEIVK
jgi:hypothetical protein